MLRNLISCSFLLFLNGNGATSDPSSYNLANNLRYIGPHNIHDTYIRIKFIQKESSLSVIEAIKSTYNIKPIVRDLNSIHNDDEIFETLIKREIAWNYPEYNEFGLLPCEQLKFNQPFGMSKYIELNADGYKVLIQKFSNSADYFKAAQSAKDLQTKCLIKSLEKGGGTSTCEVSQIPFCFSDSWNQIWWKEGE